MNFRHGLLKMFTFGLIVTCGILGTIAGVGLVLHLHNETHDNYVYPKDLHDAIVKEYARIKSECDLSNIPTGFVLELNEKVTEELKKKGYTEQQIESANIDIFNECTMRKGFWSNLPKAGLVGLCIVAGFGGAVASFFLILFASLTCRVVCSTVYLAIRKPVSYTADALRCGGKQMLCDIIKWTIIIIIAAIIFTIAYKIAVS